jgi:hypothetical protein
MHRFMLDNDGSNITYNLGDDVEGMVAETVRECPANVSTYLLCSAAGSTYYPTQVGVVNQRCPGLLAAHRRGVDPFGLLLRGLKAAGKEVFITYRMNDVHNPDSTDGWNTPRVRREHPDCVVGADEIKAGKAQWMSYCLDYSRPEVRAYVLAMIREQLDLYGDTIDGFQLDWMRFPRHLSGSPEEVWARREILTGFMADVKQMMQVRGRRLLLSARVPTSSAGCRTLGFDLAEWGRLGLVDLLVACPFLTTEWSMSVAELRRTMGAPGIPIYAGFDFGFGGQSHFPESLRGICTSLYDSGADGIYLFNFPCWTEYIAARPYHWLAGLERAATAAAKPLLFAVDHAQHRIPGVDQPAALPATIPAGRQVDISLHLPKAAFPAWRALCLAQSGGDVELLVNGVTTVSRRSGMGAGIVHWPELFLEYIDPQNPEARPKPGDCRVFNVPVAALCAGVNILTVVNPGLAEIRLNRINLGLW